MIAPVVKTKQGVVELVAQLTRVTDAMHALRVNRADELAGCSEISPGAAELPRSVHASANVTVSLPACSDLPIGPGRVLMRFARN